MSPEHAARLREAIERRGIRAVAETAEDLFQMAAMERELDGMTDAEIADLLFTAINEMDITSALSVLLENAADRLRRARGGPTS